MAAASRSASPSPSRATWPTAGWCGSADRGSSAAGGWAALTLPAHAMSPAAAELARFITTPRATQAMIRGSGVNVGRFRPSIHVTLWN